MKKVDILLVGGLNAVKIGNALAKRFQGMLSQLVVLQSYQDLSKSDLLKSNPRTKQPRDLLSPHVPHTDGVPVSALDPASSTAVLKTGQAISYKLLVYAHCEALVSPELKDILSQPNSDVFTRSLADDFLLGKYN
jgi:hypothetical protein